MTRSDGAAHRNPTVAVGGGSTAVQRPEDGASRVSPLSSEAIAFLLLALLGGYLAISSFGFGLRTNGSWVAAGTMPLLIGVPLFALATTLLVGSLRRRSTLVPGNDEDDDTTGTDIFGRTAAQRVTQLWTVVAALTGAIALVPLLGFPVAFGALVFFISTVVERRSLLVAGIVTAISLIAVHLVFVMFLGVPLPTGLLGGGLF